MQSVKPQLPALTVNLSKYTVDDVALDVCKTGAAVFFFNDTATTEIYTLSLHDALPISHEHGVDDLAGLQRDLGLEHHGRAAGRSEEHTSEIQSPCNRGYRHLPEKKEENHHYQH